ncbi:MAG: hypothetical protein CM15mP83_7230 [Flavobacteriaceae bacterium]|nr:MAG: hypothetical protein CM15mP83_7230 [Flavobacteriaceae bacterium]
MQGTTWRFFPPLSSKSSTASMPISSKVSKQSDTKCRSDNCHVFHRFLQKIQWFCRCMGPATCRLPNAIGKKWNSCRVSAPDTRQPNECLITLVSVAVLMRHRRGFTTRLIGLAMRFGDVGFAQMSFRNPMIENKMCSQFFLVKILESTVTTHEYNLGVCKSRQVCKYHIRIVFGSNLLCQNNDGFGGCHRMLRYKGTSKTSSTPWS